MCLYAPPVASCAVPWPTFSSSSGSYTRLAILINHVDVVGRFDSVACGAIDGRAQMLKKPMKARRETRNIRRRHGAASRTLPALSSCFVSSEQQSRVIGLLPVANGKSRTSFANGTAVVPVATSPAPSLVTPLERAMLVASSASSPPIGVMTCNSARSAAAAVSLVTAPALPEE